MSTKYRSFSTKLLDTPEVFECLDSDAQAVLLFLGLSTDDEGRGMAHTGMLARKFNKPPEVIERALVALADVGILMLYQVERYRYYQICHWEDWQSLSRKTPSRYPAPPMAQPADLFTEMHGNSVKRSAEGEGEQEGEKEQETEGEGAALALSNVVLFPAGRTDTTSTTGDADAGTTPAPPQVQPPSDPATATVREVAGILRLPVDDALTRIVQEYQHDPLLSLLGEADAAREFIDDLRRNRQRKPMSPTFFRRWCRREHEDAERRQATAATGTTGQPARDTPPGPGTARAVLPRSLMHLADQLPTRPAGPPDHTRPKGALTDDNA